MTHPERVPLRHSWFHIIHQVHSPLVSAIARWVICVSLAYVMIRPVGHNYLLLPALAIFAAASLALVLITRRTPSRIIAVILSSVLLVGLYGTAIGIGNPGVLNEVLVWLVAPLMFGTWAIASDFKLLKMTFVTSAITTITISMAIVVYVLGELSVIPQLLPKFLLEQGGFGFDHTYRGSTAIRFYGISTLVGAAPLWLAASLLPAHALFPRKNLCLAAAVAGLAATLVTGRAALTVVTIVVPIATWFLWRALTWRTPRSLWRTIVPVSALAITAAVMAILPLFGNVIIQRAFNRLFSSFAGDAQTSSDQVRSIESTKLLQAWQQSPLLGQGWGATIDGYSRDPAHPWNFELQYHLVLFQVGAIGALILLFALSSAIYGALRVVQTQPNILPVLLAVSAGAGSMLAANASNPYLQAPGNMWPVYLFLSIVNFVLTDPTRSDEVKTTPRA
jgi:hypothetical protein